MSVYDEVEIEDMDYDASKKTYFYPCPCGDKFFITLVRSSCLPDARRARSWPPSLRRFLFSFVLLSEHCVLCGSSLSELAASRVASRGVVHLPACFCVGCRLLSSLSCALLTCGLSLEPLSGTESLHHRAAGCVACN
jgi:hypothetical protein